MSSKHRDLEAIAFDMAKCLGIYADSYSGSPYKEPANAVLHEYRKFLIHWQGLRNQTIDSWDSLEGRIFALLSDDNTDLSETKEKAKEVVETVKCLRRVDRDGKLESIIEIAKSLKSTIEEEQ